MDFVTRLQLVRNGPTGPFVSGTQKGDEFTPLYCDKNGKICKQGFPLVYRNKAKAASAFAWINEQLSPILENNDN
jgi:hypothetical protein